MLIVDAHLDLAWNALHGRDIRQPASQQPPDEGEVATVGLPDLRQGGVGLVCATIFCRPHTEQRPGYRDHAGAVEQAIAQRDYYEGLVNEQHLRIVRGADELPDDSAPPNDGRQLLALLLMEGADPMTLAEESETASPRAWFEAGVRMVGLAWQATRYAGGTGAPGPLTADGRRLVEQLDNVGLIHDASHLADDSLRDLLELARGPICASHSNCRALVTDDPRQRQLSDANIRGLIERGAVIGTVLYDRFLLPPSVKQRRRATLADVVAHIDHICQIAGDCDHVGLGSDMDGGFGRENIPVEVDTSADLPKLADTLSAGGYGDDEIRRILGGNWLDFFQRSLPRGSR